METTASPPTPAGRDFPLGIEGFTYQDLHRDERLADLDRAFFEELHREDPALSGRLAAYRAAPASLDPLARSRLLVDAPRPVARFVARLFRVEAEWREQASGAEPEAVLFRFRRDFLLCRAVKTKLPEDLAASLPTLAESGMAIEGLFPDLPWSEDLELATAMPSPTTARRSRGPRPGRLYAGPLPLERATPGRNLPLRTSSAAEGNARL